MIGFPCLDMFLCSEHTSAVFPSPAPLPGPWGMRKARERCNAWLPLQLFPYALPVLPFVVACQQHCLGALGSLYGAVKSL